MASTQFEQHVNTLADQDERAVLVALMWRTYRTFVVRFDAGAPTDELAALNDLHGCLAAAIHASDSAHAAVTA